MQSWVSWLRRGESVLRILCVDIIVVDSVGIWHMLPHTRVNVGSCLR